MKYWILYLSLVFLSFSCDVKENNEASPTAFSRIYHNPDASTRFLPIDFREVSDGGFLILGISGDQSIYVMKTDIFGQFEWEITESGPFARPIPSLMEVNGEFLFFALDSTTFETNVLAINTEEQTISSRIEFEDELYPLQSFHSSSGDIFYHNYNRRTSRINIHGLTSTLGEIWTENYNVGFDQEIEREILDNINSTEPEVPFYQGEVEGSAYFLNSFVDFNFNSLFLNPNSGTEVSRISGFQTDASMSALFHLDGQDFAMARFNQNGTTVVNPRVTIAFNETNDFTSEEIEGVEFPGIVENAEVRIKTITVSGQKYIVYAADNKDGQISLLFYDFTSGQFINNTTIGHNHRYCISNFLQSSDEGLVILSQTVQAGKFNRISLNKVSKETLESLLN